MTKIGRKIKLKYEERLKKKLVMASKNNVAMRQLNYTIDQNKLN